MLSVGLVGRMGLMGDWLGIVTGMVACWPFCAVSCSSAWQAVALSDTASCVGATKRTWSVPHSAWGGPARSGPEVYTSHRPEAALDRNGPGSPRSAPPANPSRYASAKSARPWNPGGTAEQPWPVGTCAPCGEPRPGAYHGVGEPGCPRREPPRQRFNVRRVRDRLGMAAGCRLQSCGARYPA
jgi:hypothetical protein